ncbi:MAG: hypothetical protein U1A78_05545 [Polyangia bacterium]
MTPASRPLCRPPIGTALRAGLACLVLSLTGLTGWGGAAAAPGKPATGTGPVAAEAPAPAGATAASGASGATATLPLAEYERLAARPSVTSIDTLRIVGSFAGRELSLVALGRAAGALPKVELLAGGPTLRLHSCEGDAIVTRAAGGAFELLPQAPRFTLRCRIAVPGTDSLQLQVAPSVLWAESQVQDGELVRLADLKDPEGWRALQIVRRVEGGAGEPVPPSLTARYHLFLLPESTEFSYQLEARNPNRAHVELSIPLAPGEQVQRVETTASYELGAGSLKVKLPPGDVTVQLAGSHRGESFQPRMAASVQYALIDSHPLLRPVITTAAQRISAAETGLSPRFGYAQAFLLDKDQGLSWQARRLQALRTTSFAVNSARHTFFLASDGQVLGESSWSLSNQGAPALSLRPQAEPTFASLGDTPVLLTRDEGGALFLPLGPGKLELLLQHRQPLRRGLGFAWGTLQLPDPGTEASSGVVELRYESKWLPLYESMPPEPRFPALGLLELVGLVLLTLLTERLLRWLAPPVRRGVRVAVAGLLGGAAAASGTVLALVLVGDLGLLSLLLLPWVLRRRPSFWTVVGGLAVGGFVCLILAGALVTRSPSRPDSSDARYASLPAVEKSLERAERKEETKPKPPTGDDAAAAYQGLPAKIVMPHGAERSYLSRELLRAAVHPVRVVMVARPLVALLGDLLLGLALILLALNLPTLRTALRERWQQLVAALRE